jgi:hypothetical protein
MTPSQRATPSDAGFETAEELEAIVVEDTARRYEDEVRDLVRLADFLAPELHRESGAEEAAAAVTDWADGDADILAEAAVVARHEHQEDSARLLAQAARFVTAA